MLIQSKVNCQESLRTAHDDFLIYLTLKTSKHVTLVVINSSKITFTHWFCLNIPEEIMTQEDEEFMLDNFVTFFIAGEATGLDFVGVEVCKLHLRSAALLSFDWFCKLQHFRARDDSQSAGILYHGARKTSRHTGEVRTVHSWWIMIMALVHRYLRFFACLYFRVKKEVDEVIGMKQDISYEDLGHLGYLSQVHSLFFKWAAVIYCHFNASFSLHWILSTNPLSRYSKRLWGFTQRLQVHLVI